MFKKSPLKSSRLAKRKRQIRGLKIALAVIVLFGCCFTLYKITHVHALQIHAVNVAGNQTVDADDITAVADNAMSGSYFWFMPKTNILFYPKHLIAANLLSSLPRLNSASVSESKGAMTIEVTEREPAFTWCSGMPTVATSTLDSSDCYFMDSSGFIFSQAPVFSGNALFSLYGLINEASSTEPVASTTNPIGQQFLNADELQKFQGIVAVLEAHSQNPVSLYVGDDGVDTMYLSSGTQIIFTESQSLNDLTANLETIMSSTALLDPNATSTLDYLDLRFGNKVYYRFVSGK